MELGDRLIYSADYELLYDAMNDLIEAHQKLELDDPHRVVRIVHKFERFVSIHEVRTGDLVTLKEKVEKARTEYRALKLKYEGMKERYEETRKLLNKVLNEKMNV